MKMLEANEISDIFLHLTQCVLHLAQDKSISVDQAIHEIRESGLNNLDRHMKHTHEEGFGLSSRQRVVLQALRRGLAVKEIAYELKISEVTVRTHIQRLRSRLGCSDLLSLRMK